MKIIGLTGGVGMGKSTTAELFRRRGVPVFDADAEVHRLSAPGGRAAPAIRRAFPQAVQDGMIDRAQLGRLVFNDAAALGRLEDILHPLVAAARRRFIARARAQRRRLVVLDIPLLLERGGQSSVDYVLVVSCPAFLQTARTLRRPGMTAEKLAAIRALQMPDREKRRHADAVIATGAGRRRVLRQIDRICRSLTPWSS